MSPALTSYDQTLRATPAPSVQMAQRLLARVKDDLATGRQSPDELEAILQALYNSYAEQGLRDEREAVLDVMDCFDGWSPIKAAI